MSGKSFWITYAMKSSLIIEWLGFKQSTNLSKLYPEIEWNWPYLSKVTQLASKLSITCPSSRSTPFNRNIQFALLSALTSRRVLLEISKKPFAVNCIFVVSNCNVKLWKYFAEASSLKSLLDNLCRAREMFLYSLHAVLQEMKTPIKEITGCTQRTKDAMRRKKEGMTVQRFDKKFPTYE